MVGQDETHEDECDDECGDLSIPGFLFYRMQNDTWFFGVLLVSGMVLAVEGIDKIAPDDSGNLWVDFHLLESKSACLGTSCPMGRLVYSPTDRTTITVNARHIVAAFELADT